MDKKKLVLIMMFLMLPFAQTSFVQNVARARSDGKKANDGKKLFLDANIALSENRFADAHAIAEKLIRDYAGDYQISLYLSLYVHTLYCLDEDFQEGMLRPTPSGIQDRIKVLKAKRDKNVIDLVKLVMVGNGPGGGFSIEYLEEVLQKFPDSIWRDWAEWMLIQEKEYRPREKYQDKSPEERSKLLMRDLYKVGKKFIGEHSDSYMLPKLLKATAGWGHWCDALVDALVDASAKDEAVRMCDRVLKDYPSAEYHCARAREILRELLGEKYKEPEGCSEEQDRIITRFYCHGPDEYKRCVREYL